MCELFGYSGPESRQLNGLLSDFFTHSKDHPNGWGLAFLEGNQAEIEKEPLMASHSAYLRERLREPVTASVFLAHIRYATIGNIERRNCHPFTGLDASGRRWTLIHNGTVFEYPAMDAYVLSQKGETDSERILLHILALMDREIERLGRALTDSERFDVLDRLMISLSEGNKINLLIFDGSFLYVHTNQEGTLYARSWEDGTLFVTCPLFPDLWTYDRVPLTRLLSYQEGRLVRKGTDHGHRFIQDDDKIRLLYLSFSGL